MRGEEKRFVAAGGKEYRFLFDYGGMVAAEDAADATFENVVRGAFNGRLGMLAALVYGGLKRNHPDLTMDDIHTLLDQNSGADSKLGAKMWDALGLAQPLAEDMPPEAEAGNPPKAAGERTMTRSSPRGRAKASTRTASGGKRQKA